MSVPVSSTPCMWSYTFPGKVTQPVTPWGEDNGSSPPERSWTLPLSGLILICIFHCHKPLTVSTTTCSESVNSSLKLENLRIVWGPPNSAVGVRGEGSLRTCP